MQQLLTDCGPIVLGIVLGIATSGVAIGLGKKFIAGLAWVKNLRKGDPASVAAHAAIEVLEVVDKEDEHVE